MVWLNFKKNDFVLLPKLSFLKTKLSPKIEKNKKQRHDLTDLCRKEKSLAMNDESKNDWSESWKPVSFK